MTCALTRKFADCLLRSAGQTADRHAAMLLADFVACARAGAHGRPPIGDPPRMAALSHVDDRDDVHWETLVHCGSVIWPTALSSAPSARILLEAATVGYEAMVRLARYLGPGYRQQFHVTTAAGTVGVAATAAYARGFPAAVFTDALAHAVSVMGGSAQTVRERRETRLFHRAHAVRTGLAAADAASDGWCGTRFGLEALGPGEQDALIAPAAPALAGTSVRLFAVSGWNQAAVDAAQQVRGRIGGPVRGAVVRVSPQVADQSAGPRPEPADRAWSLEWSVAAALDPASAQAVAGRIEIDRSGGSPLQARVEVTTDSGVAAAEVSWPSGHPRRPASEMQLREKWRELAGLRADSLLRDCAEVLRSTGPIDLSALLCQEREEKQ